MDLSLKNALIESDLLSRKPYRRKSRLTAEEVDLLLKQGEAGVRYMRESFQSRRGMPPVLRGRRFR